MKLFKATYFTIVFYILCFNLAVAQTCLYLNPNYTSDLSSYGLDTIDFDVILLGETHGLKPNSALQLSFILI